MVREHHFFILVIGAINNIINLYSIIHASTITNMLNKTPQMCQVTYIMILAMAYLLFLSDI